MKKFAKSSRANYLKHLVTCTPNGSSRRSMPDYDTDRIHRAEHFKKVLPGVHLDKMTGKGSAVKPPYECLEPMNEMINCLKMNNYNEAKCESVITSFMSCYDKFKTDYATALENARKGVYVIKEGQTKFPVKFADRMLKQFPSQKKLDNRHDIPIKN